MNAAAELALDLAPAPLSVQETALPGLLVLQLPVHHDLRGWFKEAWQRQAMTALGLPDFEPVQQNMSWNAQRGTTRGFHAEPWDKLVTVAHGSVFGAWVDLRPGPSFGRTAQVRIDPTVAVFVPRGVANAYQSLEDGTAYCYLVNDHWRPGVGYPAVNLADPELDVPWPIALDRGARVSPKDRANPPLAEAIPVPPLKTLITGAQGQLGRALATAFPEAHAVGRHELDITDAAALAAWPWHEYAVVLNAAAYTAVDVAESAEGRPSAWAVNATAPGLLARIAREHRLTLVHYSTDYVFDGHAELHSEDEPLSPLGVYGQSKAAGDLAAATAPRHYVVRSSWVVGQGHNFVRTMRRLARTGASPRVVGDQVGRLTFADELARATRHLLETRAAYGTYNVTNGGAPTSWADIAREVFALSGRDPGDVTEISSAQYAAVAPRPRHSVLDLSRLQAAGFDPADARSALRSYLAAE
ncbi:dTDP-4-dehydrorhamnose reductase [Nocardioides panaciterrulae]|uniref:dTDP-4-dehydrorhamnose reductase n=1 Tax=Nocardioides panaciterrulae TaxID=661492 RepID=A0A7Y9J9D7_9ACTN|nr:dTDP-4-dehydrorhamnose reductase [Nocardioides panaciterrulae]NYD40492.1 dTDP-4-dehydrorhamnose 3,5-epimerase [Nocardioides panaciterrulae]